MSPKSELAKDHLGATSSVNDALILTRRVALAL